MSRGTTHRTVRIDDGLWNAAKVKAEAEGVNLSDVIRDALRAYVEQVDAARADAWDEGFTAAAEWPNEGANPYRTTTYRQV